VTPKDAEATFVIIPAFNEERVIRSVVERVLTLGVHVVVVDDSSEDRTLEMIKDLPINILHHSINLGQGAAIQTGIDFALQRGAKYLITFDADGQHDEQDIPLLIDTLIQKHRDVVLGSRFLGTAINMSRSRRWLLKGAILFTRLTLGLRLTDVHNGIRAFRSEAAKALRISQNRMAHASEILYKIKKAKLSFTEVPSTIRYTDYSKAKGQSTLGIIDILYDLFIRKLLR
jgi:glycosyltransferase involved in cell wall biosynthesis